MPTLKHITISIPNLFLPFTNRIALLKLACLHFTNRIPLPTWFIPTLRVGINHVGSGIPTLRVGINHVGSAILLVKGKQASFKSAILLVKGRNKLGILIVICFSVGMSKGPWSDSQTPYASWATAQPDWWLALLTPSAIRMLATFWHHLNTIPKLGLFLPFTNRIALLKLACLPFTNKIPLPTWFIPTLHQQNVIPKLGLFLPFTNKIALLTRTLQGLVRPLPSAGGGGGGA